MRLSREEHRARIWPVHPAEDLDERGLPGAVLAGEAEDGPPVHGQRDGLERARRAEPLRYGIDPQKMSLVHRHPAMFYRYPLAASAFTDFTMSAVTGAMPVLMSAGVMANALLR